MKFFRLFTLFISLLWVGLAQGQTPDTLSAPAVVDAPEPKAQGLDAQIDAAFKPIADAVGSVIFYSIPVTNGVNLPIVLIILIGGAIFCTFYFGFPNIRLVWTAIKTVKGDFKDHKPAEVSTAKVLDDNLDTITKENAEGEVSHFQALTAALSATVGLGNIAGVAVALSIGGPGATFWMIVAGFLGMASKFTECTLGVKYRDVDADGTVHGGPMYYLQKGLAERGLAGLGKVFAVFFAIMCVGGSFGGGNMFQANQAAQQFLSTFGIVSSSGGFVFGVVIALLTALIIIGGIKRIATVTDKLVPFMALLYVGTGLVILAIKAADIPAAVGLIFSQAFDPTAVAGGLLGAIIAGFKRAAFSNEAGVGSAAIAHSAVKTKFAASEGIVALLEPFIDTVIICTMSALVIVVVNMDAQIMTYGQPLASAVGTTSQVFESVIPYSSYVLMVVVVLFAFSTMISWSYYGLQAWKYLFGKSQAADISYKVIFCIFTVIGASASLGAVIDFSDAMIFAMVFPNMIGLLLLAPVVKKEVNTYLDYLKEKFNHR